jgi:hypothetical protein
MKIPKARVSFANVKTDAAGHKHVTIATFEAKGEVVMTLAPQVGCPNDNDGDGDCHLCRRTGKCLNKP